MLTWDARNLLSLLHTACMKLKIMRLMCHRHTCWKLQIHTKYNSENGKPLVTEVGAHVTMILAFFFLSFSA